MLLWGKEWTRQELLARIGSAAQLGGLESFVYTEGKARGVRGVRVRTATGFEFTVLPDRALDIVAASYQGRSLCWHSPAGVVHPAYYDSRGLEWLKSFPGGLVATCGLSTVGVPSVDGSEQLGLHGSISNTPAERVYLTEDWEGDELFLTVRGRVREAALFGPNLVLDRTIRTSVAGRSLRLEDRITNEGAASSPLMLYYHCNFGFPLLTDRSRIYLASANTEGRTPWATQHLATWQRFEPPVPAIEERCYYHSLRGGADGDARLLLVDDERSPSLAVQMRYSARTLPEFVEWKLNQPGQFVLGLEPATNRGEGRALERDAGRLRMLEPGEEISMHLELSVLDSAAQIAAAIPEDAN